MLKQFEPFLSRWRSSTNRKHELDILIERANPNAVLYDRVVWLIDLLQWIRYAKSYNDNADIRSTTIPGARIKFFLQILERNIEVKRNVAKTLRSVIRDMSSSELFLEVGLPREEGFWAEFNNRVMLKILPEPAVTSGMPSLFSALFAQHTDSDWLTAIDEELIGRIIQLMKFEADADSDGWNSLHDHMKQAMILLAVDIQASGLSLPIRKRLGIDKVEHIPFSGLTNRVESLIATTELQEKKAGSYDFLKRIAECRAAITSVYRHLDTFGVSSKVVYTLDALEAKMRRLEELVLFYSLEANDPESIRQFMIRLIVENQERKSVSALFLHNSKLLAKKIVDRNAETGEHYIAHSDSEYKAMFRGAAGGGIITAFTIYIKLIMSMGKFSLFFQGFFFSLNYSISFLVIHFCGFTLATKQPAMTGPALASRMSNIDNEKDFNKLIDEIVCLIQTLVIGVIGNAGLVIPCVMLVEMFVQIMFRRTFLSADGAEHIFHATSILGMAPFYAAFTGVLLWLSSVFAGWVDNWFALNRLDVNIRYNRRLIFIFGANRCDRWAAFLKRNISSIAASISLGILLGLPTAMFQFFGINLEVRHVTLQSGSFAAGVMYYGLQSFKMPAFYLAILGIMAIATLNIAVSFTLAFLVAVRSREVQVAQRRHIYKALWRRFLSNPWRFFFRGRTHKH